MVSYKLAQLISIVVFTCACMNIEAGLISRNAPSPAPAGLPGGKSTTLDPTKPPPGPPSGGGGKQLSEADKASLIEKVKAKAAAGGTPGPSPAGGPPIKSEATKTAKIARRTEGAPTPTKRQTTPGSAGGGAKLPQLSEAEKASLIEKVKAKAAAGGSGAPGPSPAGGPPIKTEAGKTAKITRRAGEESGGKPPVPSAGDAKIPELSEATKANILDRVNAKAQAAGTTVHPDITKHLSPTPPAKTRKRAETGTPSGNQPPGVPAGDTKIPELTDASKANILDRVNAKAKASGTTVHPDITAHLSPTPPAKTKRSESVKALDKQPTVDPSKPKTGSLPTGGNKKTPGSVGKRGMKDSYVSANSKATPTGAKATTGLVSRAAPSSTHVVAPGKPATLDSTKLQPVPGSAGGGGKLPPLSEAEKASLIEKVKAKAAAGGTPGASLGGPPIKSEATKTAKITKRAETGKPSGNQPTVDPTKPKTGTSPTGGNQKIPGSGNNKPTQKHPEEFKAFMDKHGIKDSNASPIGGNSNANPTGGKGSSKPPAPNPTPAPVPPPGNKPPTLDSTKLKPGPGSAGGGTKFPPLSEAEKASLIEKVKAKAAAGGTPGTTTTSPGGPPIKSETSKTAKTTKRAETPGAPGALGLDATKTKSAPSSTGGKIKTLDPRNNKPPQRHSAEEVRAFMDKYGIKDSTVSPNFGISSTTPTGTGGYNSNITPTGTGGYNSNITPPGTGGYNSNTTPTGTGGYSKPSTGNLKSQTGYDKPPSNTTPTGTGGYIKPSTGNPKSQTGYDKPPPISTTTPSGTGGNVKPSTGNFKSQTGNDKPPPISTTNPTGTGGNAKPLTGNSKSQTGNDKPTPISTPNQKPTHPPNGNHKSPPTNGKPPPAKAAGITKRTDSPMRNVLWTRSETPERRGQKRFRWNKGRLEREDGINEK
ncbi:hypothetical protein MJO28_004561 [Puccinia striiformis f. sp. tritici]|uniref:Uncharacterized protein n=1 Tax=Puccinia striiformis f. sp. tritici TaxID=168172 RepID=A0ACC0EQ62_9BASI|nr:hypothetical protein MJO28_004561 [Puccinia striiformis f. sp. tritici]